MHNVESSLFFLNYQISCVGLSEQLNKDQYVSILSQTIHLSSFVIYLFLLWYFFSILASCLLSDIKSMFIIKY